MSLNKHLIQIKDFPEYSVDEHGNIYNKNNEKLSQCINRNGYLMVKLCRIGGHANAILACCNGRYKQHHGYSFEWV